MGSATLRRGRAAAGIALAETRVIDATLSALKDTLGFPVGQVGNYHFDGIGSYINPRVEFAGQFGTAIEDLRRVTDFAGSQGLAIVRTSVSERTVIASGTVAQMNRAFRVELGHYKSPTEEYRGREGHVHLN